MTGSSDPYAIIMRCTRNGHTAWQAVAQQLGKSVDYVRSQYDATYQKAKEEVSR